MLEPWTKEGEPIIMAKRFGKELRMQNFRNPQTGELDEFALFAQKDWSVVLAITEDNEVLVVKEYKQGRDSIDDELPAGTNNFSGEDPKVVASRELLEETGYRAQKMLSLGFGWIATRSSPTRFWCFLATGCRKVAEAKLDRHEQIESRLVTFNQWLQMVMGGEITEPSAVMTTMRALPHLGYEIRKPTAPSWRLEDPLKDPLAG